MKMTLLRVSFLVGIIALLWLKSPWSFAAVIAVLELAAWGERYRLTMKTLRSIALFNAGVSLGYLLAGWIQGAVAWDYLIYINLKVFALTFFVLWFFRRVDLVQFFAFSKELSYLLSLSLSQIISYRKSFEEFRLAYRARVVKKLRERQKRFIVTVFGFFFEKAMHDASERSLAMKARGLFD